MTSQNVFLGRTEGFVGEVIRLERLYRKVYSLQGI